MVSKDTIITEFINQYPEHVHILTEAGFPCVGCLEAGIDVYDLIDTINAAIDNSQNEDKKEDTPNFTSGIKE